jgi:hypothetical protein
MVAAVADRNWWQFKALGIIQTGGILKVCRLIFVAHPGGSGQINPKVPVPTGIA